MAEQGKATEDRDALLAVRCQLGEPEAFDALARRWAGPLRRYLRGWAGSEDAADDLTQEVWLRVLRSLPGLRDPHRLRPWLFGIAHRAAMDMMRRRYRADPVDDRQDAQEIEGCPDQAERLEREAMLAAMEGALDRVTLPERQALTLFYLETLSIDEIARIAAVPHGTVKSRLFRGRNQLRALLVPENGK